MTAKEHYEQHLAGFYSWMTGDISTATRSFSEFLNQHGLSGHEKVAIDLGAGNGIQTLALANRGYKVVAIDFNKKLLDELTQNASGFPVSTVCDDILNIRSSVKYADLIVCCGDTLCHLRSTHEAEALLADIGCTLYSGGRVILSFRDYSGPVSGDQHIVPVKGEENRILTCVLNYLTDHVFVTDLLHERINGRWVQKVSTYKKLRLDAKWIAAVLDKNGFGSIQTIVDRGIVTIIAVKS